MIGGRFMVLKSFRYVCLEGEICHDFQCFRVFCDVRFRLTDMVGCGVVFGGMVNGFVDGVGRDALVFDISDVPVDVVGVIGHDLGAAVG